MKRELITVPLLLLALIAAIFVTADGWQLLVSEFADKDISTWQAWVFGLGFSILRMNPLSVKKKIEGDNADIELLTILIVSLIFDCLAVYWLLPYALGL